MELKSPPSFWLLARSVYFQFKFIRIYCTVHAPFILLVINNNTSQLSRLFLFRLAQLDWRLEKRYTFKFSRAKPD